MPMRHLPLEICQRLKAAGFPCDTYFWWVKHRDEGLVWGQVERGDYQTKETEMLAPCPTLSELLDAIGDNFFNLGNNAGKWYADGMNPDWPVGDRIANETGPTPEEAVVNLWLALHTPK